MNPPIIFIVGPTCIGKSNFAIEFAKKNNGEIINADSMQVYSNLKILTARPSNADQKKIQHHLYGYVDGSIRYNVSSWCYAASNIIKENNKKNKISIFVGGTGMYIDKLINGLFSMPSIPEEIKKESENLLKKKGNKEFGEIVSKIDRDQLNKISINDSSRLRLIWEIYRYTNKSKTYWLNKKNTKYIFNQDYKILLFTPNREKIYERVNKRFISMIDKGAINEVRKLCALNLDKSLPVMRAHGVPELIDYLSKKISKEQCISKGQQVTRNYVKRQLTWWRSSKLQIKERYDHFPTDIDINFRIF